MITIRVDGCASGAANMHVDEQLAQEALSGRSDVVVRFYSWDPPCISLGHHQEDDLLDRQRVLDAGVDVVRRPTGGGAILHADELTYAVTLAPGLMRPLEVYDTITGGIIEGLRQLGIVPDDDASSLTRFVPTPVCFSGFARNEIRCGGKKVVGSAQRVYRTNDGSTAILQHGSILLGPRHADLPLYLSGCTDAERVTSMQTIRDRSTDLPALIGRRPDADELIGALSRGLRSTFDRARITNVVEVSA